MSRILAIFLGLFLFAGEVGMTFVTHYCQGEPTDSKWILAEKDISCSMMEGMEVPCEKEASCKRDGPMTLKEEMNCCDNEVRSFKIVQDYLTTQNQPTLPEGLSSLISAGFPHLLVGIPDAPSKGKEGYDTGPPVPLPSSDHLSVLFQVFRL